MERLQLISASGRQVLLMDLSSCQIPEGLQVLERAKPLIRDRAPHSVLVLTDVSNSKYNSEWASAIKIFARDNTPFVLASAIVGVTPIGEILVRAVQAFAGRSIKAFDDRQSAIDWLVTQ